MDEVTLFKNRMNELAERSFNKYIYTYSDFLTLSQQSDLQKMRLKVKVSFYGGCESSERCIAVFGDAEEFGYEPDIPVSFIKIEPVLMKFADDLSHRDFLGSLMGLGIRREMLGDIFIKDNVAFLICMDSVSAYIIEQLDKVRHTSVICSICDCVPSDVLPELTYKELIVASERLDVLISAVYNLSRNESQHKIEGETVFCNSKMISSTSFIPDKGAVISVRGHGRFIYDGILRTTKKGRNVIAVRIY